MDTRATVEYLLRHIPSVNETASCLDVLDRFHEDKMLYALPIVNHANQPVGLVARQQFTEYFSKPFSKELQGKKLISTLMDHNFIAVDKTAGIEEVARITLDAGMQHMVSGFIITDHGLYFGMANGYDLLNEITTLKQKQLFDLAHFDHLTGLPNRRLLLDRIQHALATLTPNQRQGALLFIDLDHFKTINDTLGHPSGDLLLQLVGQRLISCVRQTDTVARIGGDEFVVMLEGLSEHDETSATQIETVGEKILATLAQPYQLGESKYRVTPSIGATRFNDARHSPDELMKQADIAMYQAKKAGRNTLRFFDLHMQKNIEDRAFLENELRTALDKKQFQLHYQIQVDSLQNPLGAEALIRWKHPERGMVSPAQFIPLAEETRLIIPMGLWILDTACAQIKAWQNNPHTRQLVLAVNVSAKQFHHADFVPQVLATLRHHAIPPHLLKLELTESMLVDNIEDTIRTMNLLKEIGIRISLDDFGTGYSSLQYLRLLPLDQLKIDQSFVRDLDVNSRSGNTIVRTIIAMAQSLGLEVIAEGVETEQQKQLLQSYGCAHYQGYLFGKPVPVEQLDARLNVR